MCVCANVPVVLVTVKTFITLWYYIFIFLFDTLPVSVLYYQPSCQNYFHIAIVFKFVAVKVMLQHWRRLIAVRRQLRDVYRIFQGSSINDILRRANVLSDRPS